MKRNMILVREILKWAEDQEHGYVDGMPEVEGYSQEDIGYHIHLMNQAGLVIASERNISPAKTPTAILRNLTWDGHDFLSASSDETIWSKAKTTIIKPSSGVAFDVLLEWLKMKCREKIGLPKAPGNSGSNT